MREILKDTGAIDYIMSDLTKEDTAMGYNLLVEVEAESWSNGARGTYSRSRLVYLWCILRDMVIALFCWYLMSCGVVY